MAKNGVLLRKIVGIFGRKIPSPQESLRKMVEKRVFPYDFAEAREFLRRNPYEKTEENSKFYRKNAKLS